MSEAKKQMTEVEILKEKLAQAEERVMKAETTLLMQPKIEGKLIQLPNGDLHRGIRPELFGKDPNVEVIPSEHAHPMNQAMSQVLLAAKGGKTLTCLWCGLQFDGMMAEGAVRKHLAESHASVVTPSADAEILMANLAEAQKRLAEANV